MQLPTSPAAQGSESGCAGSPGAGAFQDPNHFTEVFLGAFRRDIQSFYPGSRIEREAILNLAGLPASASRTAPTFTLDFQLDDEHDARDAVRVSLFGAWYRVAVTRGLGLGPRDRDLIRAIGRVMELHHQVLFRWSRVSLLQLRRGMPEDHYVAACVDPSAYSSASTSPSRIAEVILTLRTLALSTYENRRVSTGALVLGPGACHRRRGVPPQPSRGPRGPRLRRRAHQPQEHAPALRRPADPLPRRPAGQARRPHRHPPLGRGRGTRIGTYPRRPTSAP